MSSTGCAQETELRKGETPVQQQLGERVTMLEWCLGSCSLWEAHAGSAGEGWHPCEAGAEGDHGGVGETKRCGLNFRVESVLSTMAIGEQSPYAFPSCSLPLSL